MPHLHLLVKNQGKPQPQPQINQHDLSMIQSTATTPKNQTKFRNQNNPETKITNKHKSKQPQIRTSLKDCTFWVELSDTVPGNAETRVVL